MICCSTQLTCKIIAAQSSAALARPITPHLTFGCVSPKWVVLGATMLRLIVVLALTRTIDAFLAHCGAGARDFNAALCARSGNRFGLQAACFGAVFSLVFSIGRYLKDCMTADAFNVELLSSPKFATFRATMVRLTSLEQIGHYLNRLAAITARAINTFLVSVMTVNVLALSIKLWMKA